MISSLAWRAPSGLRRKPLAGTRAVVAGTKAGSVEIGGQISVSRVLEHAPNLMRDDASER
jgi:hypothetical protein